MIRRTPVRKRRAKPRRGPLRDKGYRDWLKFERCAIANADCYPGGYAQSDPAHTENNGMWSKGPDSSCAPLCRLHHQEYDAGRADFELRYNVDMKATAAKYWARYQQEKAA